MMNDADLHDHAFRHSYAKADMREKERKDTKLHTNIAIEDTLKTSRKKEGHKCS